MSAQQSARRRASENPDTQARWGQVWVDADRRQPFKIESRGQVRRRFLGLF